jgi:hypothetical protein
LLGLTSYEEHRRYTLRARAALIGSALLGGVLLWIDSTAAQSGAADAGRDVASRTIVLTLKIAERQSGLKLEATKSVPQGSNALQILQDTVVVKYKTYPDLGAFVTGLCGIDAPEGMVWTFTVDDKWSTVGIGNLTLERDTVIEWTTR